MFTGKTRGRGPARRDGLPGRRDGLPGLPGRRDDATACLHCLGDGTACLEDGTISFDFMTGESLYRKVADDIKAAIAAGAYPPGALLPSEAELAERYAVSRGTVRQAFAALRADGVIASRRGARRVVIAGPRVQSFGELLSFSRWARAIGEVPSGRVVSLDRRPADDAEAARLGLADGGLVLLPGAGAAAVRPAGDGRARRLPGEGRRPRGGPRPDRRLDHRAPRGTRRRVHRRRARHRRGARVRRGRPLAGGAGRRAAAARAAVHHGPCPGSPSSGPTTATSARRRRSACATPSRSTPCPARRRRRGNGTRRAGHITRQTWLYKLQHGYTCRRDR